jgi:hypothetical protein
MKVYISNYRNHWVSPYTILEKVFFWREIEYDEPIIRKLSHILEPFSTAWMKFLDFVHPRINYIKIDRWDTWNMDSTLAPIILPMLKKLRKEKHGSGFVDLQDVPEHLRYTTTEDYDSQSTFEFYNEHEFKEGEADIHARWNWVLDEMIFAFEHLVDDSWEEAYSSGEFDIVWVPDDKHPNLKRMEHGPNHTYKCDYEGLQKVYDRIDNGLRLFGRYYRNLWD